MSARSDILSAIRTQQAMSVPAPPEYRAPTPADLVQAFADRAQLASAEVRFIDSETDVPETIADLLRARNLPAVVHVPPSCTSLPWHTAHGLTIDVALPGPDDAAVAIAPFGIAETGTLAYPSQENSPASWHFRACFEIAILRADAILPHIETVIGCVRASGLPSTINFVTGPSRTGDIEQTLELGAHGPKALTILIVRA
jgi:L-lactate dehydrogenase complex protein LldG